MQTIQYGHRNHQHESRNGRALRQVRRAELHAVPGVRSCAAKGRYVWDDQGRQYLDFFPGWGCNLLGHCPPRVVEAIQQQVAELIHVPNTWHTEVPGPLGPVAFGAELRRQGVLLQFGRGGERGGDQAGPAARAGRAATRSSRFAAAFTAERTAPPARRPSRSITKGSGRCWPVFCTRRSAIWTPCAS